MMYICGAPDFFRRRRRRRKKTGAGDSLFARLNNTLLCLLYWRFYCNFTCTCPPPKVQKIAVIFQIEGLLCDNYWPQSESFGRPRKCVWAEEAVSKNAKQWSIARFASNRRLLAVGKNVRIHPTHKQHTKLFAGCQKSTESKQSPTCEKKALLKLD